MWLYLLFSYFSVYFFVAISTFWKFLQENVIFLIKSMVIFNRILIERRRDILSIKEGTVIYQIRILLALPKYDGFTSLIPCFHTKGTKQPPSRHPKMVFLFHDGLSHVSSGTNWCNQPLSAAMRC